jgi:outer membrane lipoprotein-sorting protein
MYSKAPDFPWRLPLGILLCVAAILSYPGGLAAQTADDVISAYLKARGGLDKIKAVQTERVTATLTLQPGTDATLIYERKRPLKMHMEIITGGRSFLRVYDGKSSGWVYNPFTPNPVVQAMSANEIPGVAEESDLDGPFVDYKAKGNRIEYAGKEDVEGVSANKLKLTSRQGEVSFFLFNPSTGLILKWEGTRKVKDRTTGEDVEVPWQNFFRDFREVNGLKYPFVVESGAVDGSQTQKISTSKVEINIPLDDAEFAEPKPTALPAEPAGTN